MDITVCYEIQKCTMIFALL